MRFVHVALLPPSIEVASEVVVGLPLPTIGHTGGQSLPSENSDAASSGVIFRAPRNGTTTVVTLRSRDFAATVVSADNRIEILGRKALLGRFRLMGRPQS